MSVRHHKELKTGGFDFKTPNGSITCEKVAAGMLLTVKENPKKCDGYTAELVFTDSEFRKLIDLLTWVESQ